MTTDPLFKKYRPAHCPLHMPVPKETFDDKGRQQWECMQCGQVGWDTPEDFRRKYGGQPQR